MIDCNAYQAMSARDLCLKAAHLAAAVPDSHELCYVLGVLTAHAEREGDQLRAAFAVIAGLLVAHEKLTVGEAMEETAALVKKRMHKSKGQFQ
jgi:hypothetical protein